MNALKKWYESLSRLNKISTWLAIATVAVFAFTAILATSVEGSREAARESADVSTIEGLTEAIVGELGQDRSVDVSISEELMYVSFALDENLTGNLTIGSAWQDVAKVVKLVQRSGLSDNLTISGSLELIDTNGNSLGQQVVFTASFLEDKVQLLNTDNLMGADLWENAASLFVYHPALKD